MASRKDVNHNPPPFLTSSNHLQDLIKLTAENIKRSNTDRRLQRCHRLLDMVGDTSSRQPRGQSARARRSSYPKERPSSSHSTRPRSRQGSRPNSRPSSRAAQRQLRSTTPTSFQPIHQASAFSEPPPGLSTYDAPDTTIEHARESVFRRYNEETRLTVEDMKAELQEFILQTVGNLTQRVASVETTIEEQGDPVERVTMFVEDSETKQKDIAKELRQGMDEIKGSHLTLTTRVGTVEAISDSSSTKYNSLSKILTERLTDMEKQKSELRDGMEKVRSTHADVSREILVLQKEFETRNVETLKQVLALKTVVEEDNSDTAVVEMVEKYCEQVETLRSEIGQLKQSFKCAIRAEISTFLKSEMALLRKELLGTQEEAEQRISQATADQVLRLRRDVEESGEKTAQDIRDRMERHEDAMNKRIREAQAEFASSDAIKKATKDIQQLQKLLRLHTKSTKEVQRDVDCKLSHLELKQADTVAKSAVNERKISRIVSDDLVDLTTRIEDNVANLDTLRQTHKTTVSELNNRLVRVEERTLTPEHLEQLQDFDIDYFDNKIREIDTQLTDLSDRSKRKLGDVTTMLDEHKQNNNVCKKLIEDLTSEQNISSSKIEELLDQLEDHKTELEKIGGLEKCTGGLQKTVGEHTSIVNELESKAQKINPLRQDVDALKASTSQCSEDTKTLGNTTTELRSQMETCVAEMRCQWETECSILRESMQKDYAFFQQEQKKCTDHIQADVTERVGGMVQRTGNLEEMYNGMRRTVETTRKVQDDLSRDLHVKSTEFKSRIDALSLFQTKAERDGFGRPSSQAPEQKRPTPKKAALPDHSQLTGRVAALESQMDKISCDVEAIETEVRTHDTRVKEGFRLVKQRVNLCETDITKMTRAMASDKEAVDEKITNARNVIESQIAEKLKTSRAECTQIVEEQQDKIHQIEQNFKNQQKLIVKVRDDFTMLHDDVDGSVKRCEALEGRVKLLTRRATDLGDDIKDNMEETRRHAGILNTISKKSGDVEDTLEEYETTLNKTSKRWEAKFSTLEKTILDATEEIDELQGKQQSTESERSSASLISKAQVDETNIAINKRIGEAQEEARVRVEALEKVLSSHRQESEKQDQKLTEVSTGLELQASVLEALQQNWDSLGGIQKQMANNESITEIFSQNIAQLTGDIKELKVGHDVMMRQGPNSRVSDSGGISDIVKRELLTEMKASDDSVKKQLESRVENLNNERSHDIQEIAANVEGLTARFEAQKKLTMENVENIGGEIHAVQRDQRSLQDSVQTLEERVDKLGGRE